VSRLRELEGNEIDFVVGGDGITVTLPPPQNPPSPPVTVTDASPADVQKYFIKPLERQRITDLFKSS
jgi:hypothetical protein